MAPPWGSHHAGARDEPVPRERGGDRPDLLGLPHVLHAEAADPEASRYVTRTPFMYFETQLDRQLILAGVTHHHLTCVNGALRIRLKKIELVNCDAAFPSIQLLL